MGASEDKTNMAATFANRQHELVERVFEPQLVRLNLGHEQIEAQTLEQLYESLEAINEAMKHPESFGTVRMKTTAELRVIAVASSESQFESGILPLLIERKQLINARIRQLGGKAEVERHERNQDAITVRPVFSSITNAAQFQTDVFVIMPFSKQFEAVYTDVIRPTGEELGLTVKRGDDFFSHHNIMDEIWFAIYGCRFVIADCTGRNPNVFYELGIAHTLGKQYILLTQDVNDVPFDVRGRRFLVYEDRLGSLGNLRRQLVDALAKLTQ